MAKRQVDYDEQAIKTLDPMEHIRLRTGMYLGRLGNGTHPSDGIYVMIKEVIDNAVDEFIMGAGRKIEVSLDDSGVTVRDYGRGIPLGKVVDCVAKINTGGKYNDDVFQFSVGLNGVGTKAVNALSEHFEVCSWRDGQHKRALFSRGKLIKESGGKDSGANGTLVHFRPDPEIFKKFSWNDEFIERRLRYYAYLNSGLTIIFNNQRFQSREGLADLLREELGDTTALYEPCHHRGDKLEFALTHTGSYGENYFSFVNGQYTNDGGTHQSAFREGVLKAVNDFAGRSFAGEDVRDGLIGAVSIKLQDPVFESQTKNKLGSTEVRTWVVPQVRDAVLKWLHQNKDAASLLVDKIKANERLRKELAAVKKQARERAKKVAIRIPKLIDCKYHRGDKHRQAESSMIFLTEGDSAGGAMIQARNVETQAIFALKGKPLNCFGLKREAIYKNEELYNIMRALGIEDDVEQLRYQKVVIATDADVDGMHIRNLLITYFLRYFEELVTSGHLYILETPLFRVRNKQQARYCYSEEERDAATAELKAPEVTRFKGLGEISPGEFKGFLGDDIRLAPVGFSSMGVIEHSLSFFMGKNTPERKQFIIEHLITDIA